MYGCIRKERDKSVQAFRVRKKAYPSHTPSTVTSSNAATTYSG
jgi:hypothetical protein